jgi:hypothetical protein
VTAILNIDDITTIALDGGYAGTRTISEEVGAFLLSIVTAMTDTRYWTNDIGDLTDLDIDVIDALVSLTLDELTT